MSALFARQPAIGPRPQPDESRPHTHQFLKILLILFFHVRLDRVGDFPSDFLSVILYVFLAFPYVLHTTFVSHSLTGSS
jgi:hypothetical protein